MVFGCGLFALAGSLCSRAASPIDLGSRRELFVDDFLVEKLAGGAERRLHACTFQPVRPQTSPRHRRNAALVLSPAKIARR